MVQQAIEAALAAGKIAGAVALTGSRSGQGDAMVMGYADPASSAPMHADTLFQIASMTKAVTSVAALQLVAAGKLALDTPIAEILPELADPQVITGFNDGGAPLLRPVARPITLRHLLTHTAGFGYDFMSATQAQARGANGSPAPGTLASIRTPLLFDPGDRWEYGVSTDWVGRAVEAAGGARLDAYMQAHIFDPLGMGNTMFNPSAAQLEKRAVIQLRQEDGSFAPMPLEIGAGADAEFLAGGAGLHSTAADYMRFLRMIANGGTLDGVRVLSEALAKEMTVNQIGVLRAGKMESVFPMLSLPNDMFPDQQCGWSLAFLINPQAGPNGRAAGSLAWAGIANSYFWIDPASDIIGVLMMQALPFADAGALDVLGAFERAVYGR